MGKHTAADEAVVHPLVADALQRRHLIGEPPLRRSSGVGAPNVVAAQPAAPRSAAVGWPAPPGRGDGLGWPGDVQPEPTRDGHPDDDGSLLAVLDEAAAQDLAIDLTPVPVATPEHAPVRRSGWRRFFGGGHSSTTVSGGTSAA